MSATVNQTAAAFGAGRFAIGGRRGPVDRSEVLRLSAQGIGVQNIANMLAVSMEDVRRILEPVEQPAPRDGDDNDAASPPALKTGRPHTERDARFIKMWEECWPKTEIAAAMSIHVLTVDKMRDRLGLEKRERASRPTDWTEEEAAYVHQKYVVERVSPTIIGKHLGRTRSAVIGFSHRKGWCRYRLRGSGV